MLHQLLTFMKEGFLKTMTTSKNCLMWVESICTNTYICVMMVLSNMPYTLSAWGITLLPKIFSKGPVLPACWKGSFFLGSWVQTDTTIINRNLPRLLLFQKRTFIKIHRENVKIWTETLRKKRCIIICTKNRHMAIKQKDKQHERTTKHPCIWATFHCLSIGRRKNCGKTCRWAP